MSEQTSIVKRDDGSDARSVAAETPDASRRRFLSLLGTGGAAAAASVYAPGILGAEKPAAEPIPTPAAGRLHVKPIEEYFFIPHGTNAEMRWARKAVEDNYLMDSGLFFVRSHTATPIIDTAHWELRVDGPGVSKPLRLSYKDLLQMPSKTVPRFVECAGNARAMYQKILGKPGQGTQWISGGYGIGSWTGVPLREILKLAGVKNSAVSIMATGLDEAEFKKPLPMDKAMQDDTLVVYGMNNAPLPYDHGFPVRMLASGWLGSFNVKWLGSLHVGNEQLYSHWNTSSYVLIGPGYEDPEGPSKGPRIHAQSVKSIVAMPWPAELAPGRQQIFGYAWSPYAPIAEVGVSLDGGQTYQSAELFPPNIAAAGVRWKYWLDAKPGEFTITTRAKDWKGHAQIPISEQKWNEKGYIWSAVIPHPVTVAG